MSPDVKNIIAVHSCKGGVGKSTVAAGLALTLASRGNRVGICDLDICGPSLAEFFSLDTDSVMWKPVGSTGADRGDRPSGKNVNLSYGDDPWSFDEPKNDGGMYIEPKTFQGIKVMSPEFLRSKDYSGYSAYRGPIIDRICYEMVYQTNWHGLEYLILDLPPGTSDVIVSLVETIAISGSVLVTTPHVLCNSDLVRGIKLFKDLEIPILSIVENMAYYACDSCAQRRQLFGPSRVEAICREYEICHFARLPLMPADQSGIMSNDSVYAKPSLLNIAMVSRYHEAGAVKETFDDLAKHLESKLKSLEGQSGRRRRNRLVAPNSTVYYKPWVSNFEKLRKGRRPMAQRAEREE